jgi:hypothetical protein
MACERSVSRHRVGSVHLPGLSLRCFLSGLPSPSLPFIIVAVLHPSLLGLQSIRCRRGTLTAACCWGSIGTGLHVGGWLLRCGSSDYRSSVINNQSAYRCTLPWPIVPVVVVAYCIRVCKKKSVHII